MRMVLATTLALSACLTNTTVAQSVQNHPQVRAALDVLEIWVQAQLDYERIPGISMGIVHDQELIWSKGFGFADVDAKRPALPTTLYSICSISKLFTSVSTLQLRDAGKLRLDDEVSQHLPWFTINESYPEAGPVTIEGLLTHSAGLPRESASPYWAEADFPTRSEIMERVSGQEMLYPARTYFQYSNLGLTLAGEIVAATSGMTYDDYVRQNVLDPLGMHDTYTEMPQQHAGGQLATGYSALRRDGTRMTMPFYHVNGIAPAAGYASTVEDLAAFASWQFRLLEQNGHEILDVNTLRAMQRVHWIDPNWQTTWGLGFAVSRNNGKTFVGHGGSCPGYRTQLTMQTKDKFAAIFMTNGQGINAGLYTREAYELVGTALRTALDEGEGDRTYDAFDRYVGLYERPTGNELAVVNWKGSIAMLSLPTGSPNSLTRLKHVEGDTFRRIRDDDELGEEITFDLDESGRALRLWRHDQYWTRQN